MSDVNTEIARANMVECQIRTFDVLDERLLALLRVAPREEFVPSAFRNLAYADMNIPLAHDQVMMSPMIEARLLQALAVQPEETVLEIGTGSGWVTYLLSVMAKSVDSVEIHESLSAMARRALQNHGVRNVNCLVGDAARGWPPSAPQNGWNAIFITGSLPILPDAFRQSLAVGGRLIAIVGRAPVMEATLMRRTGNDRWTTETLFETSIPPLLNAIEPSRFVF
jgi:protein-L-isoaspartate(D-aspartate) O-methyltransferase